MEVRGVFNSWETLAENSLRKSSISAPKVGGIVRLTGFIVKVTLVMELLCAAVMAPVFCRDFGKKGLWMALFHSVSAFCNTNNSVHNFLFDCILTGLIKLNHHNTLSFRPYTMCIKKQFRMLFAFF